MIEIPIGVCVGCIIVATFLGMAIMSMAHSAGRGSREEEERDA